ncbi:MAG: PAS domain-containing protein [Paracoccaceae bacterium]|nr:PAS domain-containing protein [Paracoccaceae bacterium]
MDVPNSLTSSSASRLLRTFDWGKTALGPAADWPERLRFATELLAASSDPVCLFWGPRSVMIYNDAWAAAIGQAHPWAFGMEAAAASPQIATACAAFLDRNPPPEAWRWLQDALLPFLFSAMAEEAVLPRAPVVIGSGKDAGLIVAAVTAQPRRHGDTDRPQGGRTAFMLRLSDALRRLNDPVEIETRAIEMLGRYLGADRANYAEVDLATNTAVVRTSYQRDPAALSMRGTFDLSPFAPALALLNLGVPFVVNDLTRTQKPLRSGLSDFTDIATGAQLSLGIRRADELVAGITIRFSSPHDWTAEEVATAQEAASRTWEAVERAMAEAESRAIAERFRRALDTDAVGVLFFRHDGTLLGANEAFLGMSGYSRDDVEGGKMSWRTMTPPDWVEVGNAQMAHFQETGRIGPYEKEYLHKDGRRSWLLVTGSDLGDGTLVAFTIDIQQRKCAEEALRASEARFRALTVATTNVIYRMSPDWTEMYGLNGSGFLQDTARPSADWLGTYIDPADQPRVMAAIRDAIDSKSLFQLEHRVKQPDGSLGWTLSRAVPILDAQGEIVEWFGAASDITARKHAEAALLSAEARLRLAQEAAGVGTFDWIIATHEGHWSPEFLTILGLRPGDLGGRYEDWVALVHPEDRERASREVELSMETGLLEGEWRIVRPDGSEIWVLVRGVVERDSQNRPVRLMGAQVDITDRKQAEHAVAAMIDEMDNRIETLKTQLRDKDQPT